MKRSREVPENVRLPSVVIVPIVGMETDGHEHDIDLEFVGGLGCPIDDANFFNSFDDDFDDSDI